MRSTSVSVTTSEWSASDPASSLGSNRAGAGGTGLIAGDSVDDQAGLGADFSVAGDLVLPFSPVLTCGFPQVSCPKCLDISG